MGNINPHDKMAGYAVAIAEVANELETKLLEMLEKERINEIDEESLLVPGLTISAVVLTALAAELILKAWTKRKSDSFLRIHDLYKLQENFDESIWHEFTVDEKELIQRTLEDHRNDFTHWRYLYENVDHGDPKKFPSSDMKLTVNILLRRYFRHPQI